MNFPILSAVTFLPLVGSLFILLIRVPSDKAIDNTKYVAIFTSFANFFLAIFLWYSFDTSTADFQFIENKQWVRGYFNFRFGIDGISILFILFFSKSFKKYGSIITKLGGIILLLTGFAILTGQLQVLGFFILEYFPLLGNIG